MALTTVTGSLVSVNAIQGTLIADNAITAVHIATNAVSGTLIADNAVTAVHIAQNSITVTQLADDCVESDKIADGIITTNHLNKAMISSQTEVSAATGDFVLLGDTSDSNNLKKTPVSSIIGLASGTTINNNADNRIITGSGTANTLEGEANLTFDGTTTVINNTGNADSTLLQLKNTPSTAGTYKTGLEFWSNEGTANNQTFNAGRIYSEFEGANYSDSRLTLGSASGGGTFNDEITITNGTVGINRTSPNGLLHMQSNSGTDSALYIQTSATSDDSIINFGDNGSSAVGKILYQHSSNSMQFNTLSSERMRIASSGDITMSGTGALKIPVGTTAQRPTTGANGMLRYNTSNSEFEVYNGMWLPMKTVAPLEFQQGSTYHADWTVAADGQSAQAGSGYSAITVNLNFEGNFTIISKWSHDYMGVGIGYKAGITNANFTGESNDAAGPYGGGATVDGFDSTVSYMGQYHWPISNGGVDDHNTVWYIKHSRAGNTISTHYSTNAASATNPSHSSWSQVQSATIASTDHCKPLWGEASGNESVALTLLYNDITGGFNGS